MRVIVTRPEHSGRRTADRLAGLGHDPVLLPLFKPLHDTAATDIALQGAFTAIAVTSAEALRVISALDFDKPEIVDTPVFAVGEQTAAAAQRLGFTRITTGDGDGAALAERIAASVDNSKASNILYLAGSPRSRSLESGLAAQAIRMTVVESYRMIEISHDTEFLHTTFARPVDAVFLYSRQAAACFFRLPGVVDAKEIGGRTAFFCLSHNVAEAIPQSFHKAVFVADRPDENALFEQFCRFATQQS